MEDPLLAIIHRYEPPERFRLQQYMQWFGQLLVVDISVCQEGIFGSYFWPITTKHKFPTKKHNLVAM